VRVSASRADDGQRVSVRAHFERFPATVKGAFVVRGEDADPHQVTIASARAVPAAGASAREIEIEPVTLDVAPHVDTFVPFEMPITDLEPGWYVLESVGEVDGSAARFPGAKRFLVPWPRASVRRGTLRVNRRLKAPPGSIKIDTVDCGGDSIKVHVIAERGADPSLLISADDAPLPVLDATVDEETGIGLVSAYPLLRAHSSLRIAVPAGEGEPISVQLP
jgi:hypothetical protein